MGSDQIGKYRIIGKLGQGGMARVLLTMVAGPHNFNKLMVVKELREELAQDHEFLAMFLDEARLAARLNHPNVVQTYEVGQEGERFFIAMEYLEGQPLHSILRRVGRANMPLDLHVRILADVLAGLEHAHTLADFDGSPLQVVHRDISPQNVFVTYDGQVKVVDFGIAKAAGASSTTRAGVFKGKLAYVAPEQARGAAIDARADLFAVGVMLWEAIAGRRLVQGEAEGGLLARRMAGNDPKIKDAAPEAPDDLAAICDKAMALDPNDRYDSARHFQEALEDYLDRTPYRIGPKEIGSAVASAFAEERAKVRALVEAQMKAQREAPEAEPVSIVDILGAVPAMAEPTPTLTPNPLSHSGGTLAASQMSQHPPPMAQGGGRTVIYAAAAIGIVGIAVAGFFAMNRDRAPARAPSTTEAADATPASAKAPSGPQISLKIKWPSGATAKLDGAELHDNPFVAKVPKDGSMHKLEVSGSGIATQQRMLTFESDVDLDLPADAPSSAAVATPTPVGPRGWSRPVPPSKASAAVAADPPPKPPSTDIDDPPRPPPKKPSIDIDETDPYHKH